MSGKYLTYAIGEVILVVIGILIALAINNWNETRLEKNEVANYIEQISIEIESDINHFKNDISQMQNWSDYLNKVSDGKYHEVDLSRVLIYLPRNLNVRNFGISYNKILESGLVRYIENNQMGKKLETYYLVNCSDYNDRTEFHANFISDHIEGPLLLMLHHKKGFLADPQEVIDRAENGRLKSLVNWQISYFDYQMKKSNENIVQAEELLRLIRS